AWASDVAGGVTATNGHRLEPGWADLLLSSDQQEPEIRRHGPEVPAGLGPREAVQVGTERRGRVEPWRSHEGISGSCGPREAGRLRTQHRPDGAATGKQQRECRRQLHRGGVATGKRARGRSCELRPGHRGYGYQVAKRDGIEDQAY